MPILEHSSAQIDEAISRAMPGGVIDTALAGKAPAGYGLGTDSTKITDFNAALTNGFFRSESDSVNGPFDGFIGLVFVHSSYAGATHMVRQDAYRRLSGCPEHYVRYCIAGTWKEWEYENPPMLLGVEYRTTERYLGKPVYAQLFSVGACSAGSSVNLYKRVGEINTDKIVYYCGYAADWALPYFVEDTTYNIMLAVQKVKDVFDLAINVTTGTSVSFTECYVTVKYTKTTD